MLYLIPRNSIDSSVIDQLKRSRIKFIRPETIRDLILETQDDEQVVAAISTPMVILLGARKAEYFKELPRVVTSVPGVSYIDWLNYANRFPMEDYISFAQVISKSGTTWRSVDDETATNAKGSDLEDPRTSMISPLEQDSDEDIEIAPEV